MRRQLISSDDALPAEVQHKRPCSDCPWARTALKGWIGGATREQWLLEAHGEARIECHTLIGAQCAGAAIYRANVLKKPRDPDIMVLEPDREAVFAIPQEFFDHHKRGNN